ncbi:hypothetical protein ACROYT_G028417 [Oculina patagonica]
MEIREQSILFAKQKSRDLSQREKEISKRLDYLDNNICNDTNLLNVSNTLNEFEALKTELHSIYDRKGKAAMFRSKCRWIEKGEKPTKYFFNLEKKRNYNRKTINEIRTEDNVEIREEKEILKAIQAFYEDLYSSKIISSQEQFHLFTENVSFPKLSDEDRDELEGPLTLDECKTVLESFQENKSPGEDGFTIEFYNHFFDLIGGHVLESLNVAFEVGELSISQRRGVITLIPKDDSDLVDLQNWRPITLLNTDYKIASKALARRIETILPKLIHPDQTGFMKGRYISENLRLISDVMEYTKMEELTGILVSVDFKKAFDTLEWSFIRSVLNLFNFGKKNVKRWTSVFYTNVENAVLNNGFATNWFKPTRGVRQVCLLSPYLFILSAEILSSKIRQNKLVKGINIYGNEVKVNQFADDTNLFCADLKSAEEALCLINDFGSISGLKLNVKKTKALWLGKWRNNNTTPLQLSWPRDPVKVLGIYFSYAEKANDNYNFNLKVRKLQTHLDMWSPRGLTLFGKVLIVKCLRLSQILYSASNISVPKDTTQNPFVKKKLFSFLWNKKRDKIKRESLYQDYEKGGLRMPDLDLMIKAMRLAWIPRLLKQGNFNWKSVPDFFLRKLGRLNFLLRCNYDVSLLNSKLPTFYKDMLLFFDELKTLYKYDLGQMGLFNNREILIDGKTFFINEWFSKGIFSISDLLDEQGQLLSYKAFKTKYKCKTNFLNYYQVASAIPNSLLSRTRNNYLQSFPKNIFLENNSIFELDDSTKAIHFLGTTETLDRSTNDHILPVWKLDDSWVVFNWAEISQLLSGVVFSGISCTLFMTYGYWLGIVNATLDCHEVDPVVAELHAPKARSVAPLVTCGYKGTDRANVQGKQSRGAVSEIGDAGLTRVAEFPQRVADTERER